LQALPRRSGKIATAGGRGQKPTVTHPGQTLLVAAGSVLVIACRRKPCTSGGRTMNKIGPQATIGPRQTGSAG
jgi:hypothetical protein